MSAENHPHTTEHCPECGHKGRRVAEVTLAALLQPPWAAEFARASEDCCGQTGGEPIGCAPAPRETPWRFCDSPDCDVVYYSIRTGRTFTGSQLRVPVGVKERTGDRPLCYCFGHSIASIKDELRRTGTTTALEDIRDKMKRIGCHCPTSNPSGACCLGSVARGIEIARRELEQETATPPSAITNRAGRGRIELIASAGAILSAVLASACCWLPLVLLAGGVSGAAVASTLEAYRPIFIGVAVLFLGAAFYVTYRPRRASDAQADCCPSDGEAAATCCPPAGQRTTMMTVNKAMLWVVTALVAAFILFPNYVGALLGGGTSGVVSSDAPQLELVVEGMTCEGCAAIVEQAVRQVPGVQHVSVDHQTGRVVVSAESCCPIPTEQIVSAIEQAGYTPHSHPPHEPLR
ncbi:MAG: hypothetical protein KatS3mg111_1658 [Pirellulaceae bacterium]|nr:MAG: hypothetical protein KatS3mg111_1658 [Pirellulaceae bacterium]